MKKLSPIGALLTLMLIVSLGLPVEATVISVPTDQATIQGGIDAAGSGDTVLVEPGTYVEAIIFDGKNVCLKSSEGPLVTTITSGDSVDIVQFSNIAEHGASIEGFTIFGGRIGIWCHDASPIIRRNILDGQHVTNYAALVVSGIAWGTIGSSTAIIENNTIVHCANGAIAAWSYDVLTIRNNIIAFNFHYSIHRQPDAEPPIYEYNLSYGNDDDFENVIPGIGCIVGANPLMDSTYSLTDFSPCIDAGDPDPAYNDPNGSRNDMGAVPCDGCLPPSVAIDTLYVPQEYPIIQAAIDTARWGSVILVGPGTYHENVDFMGKKLQVIGTSGRDSTFINAYNSVRPVVAIASSEPRGTKLSGFTISGSLITGILVESSAPLIIDNIIERNHSIDDYYGGGIDMKFAAGAVVRGNVIRYDTTDGNSAAIQIFSGYEDTISYNLIYGCRGNSEIRCMAVSAVIYNNTIDVSRGNGISAEMSEKVKCYNNLILNAPQYGIYIDFGGGAEAYYNDAWNCTNGILGDEGMGLVASDGNFSADPEVNEDYELASSSPCIDAGDPNPFFNDPDGSRNDIGAISYGGPISADSLIVPSLIAAYGDNTISVGCKLTQPIRGATIPIAIPSDVEILGVSTAGYVTDSWDYNVVQVKPDSGFIFVALANSTNLEIPVGYTELFGITFRGTSPVCDQALAIHLQKALTGDVTRRLTFVDASYLPIYPSYNSMRDSIVLPELITGDMDLNGSVDISDLIAMVDRMFGGGPAPLHINVMDVNGDCTGPDIADLVRIVTYVFGGGPDLPCGCIESLKKLGGTVSSDIRILSDYVDGRTVISVNSPIPLRGIEIELGNPSKAEPQKLYSQSMDLLYRSKGNRTKAGIIDLRGSHEIASGTTQLLSIEGRCEVLSAVVADGAARSIQPAIDNKVGQLPTDYALSQNYPNPFNPSTMISFTLPEASQVMLNVFNIQGQRVSTLADGMFEAGEHVVTWDGARFASGVYFYRLEAGQFAQTRKMILLK